MSNWLEMPNIDVGYIMPFGKYKGQSIRKIETEYLEWLEEEMVVGGKNTSEGALNKIAEELRRRSKIK
jgi:uncharacterized protein (DUF3820 family)